MPMTAQEILDLVYALTRPEREYIQGYVTVDRETASGYVHKFRDLFIIMPDVNGDDIQVYTPDGQKVLAILSALRAEFSDARYNGGKLVYVEDDPRRAGDGPAVRRGKMYHLVLELRLAGWGYITTGHYENGSIRTALIPPKDLRAEFSEAWHTGGKIIDVADEPKRDAPSVEGVDEDLPKKTIEQALASVKFTTVEQAKQAISLRCGLRFSWRVDPQCGGAWLVEAEEFSRITGSHMWIDLGYVSDKDKDEIEVYAKEHGG